MSKKASWPNSKGQTKDIGNYHVYLGRSWDLTHGVGWFCQLIYDINKTSPKRETVFFGFHKTNKFTAYRNALNDSKK